jgi:hypothetical protein
MLLLPASSAAASEAAAAPLDGIELQPETAPEHLPDASAEPLSKDLPDAAVEVSPSAASQNSALSASAAGEEAPAAESVLEPSTEQSAQKQRGRRLSQGKVVIQTAAPKGARKVVTRAVEALIDGEGEALGAKAVEKALQRDSPSPRTTGHGQGLA